jgi:hypothetical protein
MKLDPRRIFGSIIMLFLGPLIIIAAFNHFFAVNIPWTFEIWVMVFLVGILAALLFIGLFFLLFLGGAVISPVVGVVLAIVGIFLLPVIYIWSFNVLLSTAVPITMESYFLVGLVLIGTAFLSGLVKRAAKPKKKAANRDNSPLRHRKKKQRKIKKVSIIENIETT